MNIKNRTRYIIDNMTILFSISITIKNKWSSITHCHKLMLIFLPIPEQENTKSGWREDCKKNLYLRAKSCFSLCWWLLLWKYQSANAKPKDSQGCRGPHCSNPPPQDLEIRLSQRHLFCMSVKMEFWRDEYMYMISTMVPNYKVSLS